jgi:hypothetical protein
VIHVGSVAASNTVVVAFETSQRNVLDELTRPWKNFNQLTHDAGSQCGLDFAGARLPKSQLLLCGVNTLTSAVINETDRESTLLARWLWGKVRKNPSASPGVREQ